jgi:hypothetical protein
MTAAMLARSAAPVAACQCAARDTRGYIDAADAIVVGTVVRVVEDPNEYAPDSDSVLAVERYLKGSGPPEIVADDAIGGADCGGGVGGVGRRWVVFTSGDEREPFRTSSCAGNRAIGDGPQSALLIDEIESITGPGREPESLSATESDGDRSWPSVAVGVALLVALLLFGFLIWRRRSAAL